MVHPYRKPEVCIHPKGKTMINRTTTSLLTAAALSLSLGLTGSASALSIDFDLDAQGNPILAGQHIDDEYADWGVQISAVNLRRNHDAAIAFDTLNYTGGDRDLRTDSGRYGLNNNMERGNVMILAEDIVDANNDGYVDDPDDEGRRPAGYFDFMFDTIVHGGAVIMLDIDDRAEPGSIDFFRDGSMLDYSIDFAGLGDNSIEIIQFCGFDYDHMRINLGGSGAVAEVHTTPVPEPVTAVLVPAAIAAVGMRAGGRGRRTH